MSYKRASRKGSPFVYHSKKRRVLNFCGKMPCAMQEIRQNVRLFVQNILTFSFVFCIIDMKVMRGSGLS